MKVVTVQINDRDYADMIRHFAKNSSLGRPMIAVHKIVAIDGDEDFDIQAEAFDVQGIEDRSDR